MQTTNDRYEEIFIDGMLASESEQKEFVKKYAKGAKEIKVYAEDYIRNVHGHNMVRNLSTVLIERRKKCYSLKYIFTRWALDALLELGYDTTWYHNFSGKRVYILAKKRQKKVVQA
ncbi:MAG: hypothetical protein QXV17_09670 [Candidatus Micrarchaeaceae archaeon]